MNSNRNVHHSNNEFSLFVGDLPHDCTDESLQRLFQSKFKSVKRVQIIKNEDGSSRGFGFIRFEDQTDFQSALTEDMKINGTTLRLDMAHRYKTSRGRYNSFNSTVSNSSNHHNHHFNNSNSNPHHHHHNQSHHHHHPHPHHHSQKKNNQSQTSPQATPLIAGQTTHQQPLASTPQTQQNSAPNDAGASQVAGVSNTSSTSSTTATTTMPITSVNQTAAATVATMHNSQPNLSTTHQQAIGPDLRGHVQPMMDSHLMGATEPPPVYGHMYPYGPPPPFSYMPPPPQPNPVMPISAVPPAPPNQATTTGGQQHSLPAASAVNANRFNPNAQQHHHSQLHHHPAHHHQPQQPAHVGAGIDATGLGTMPGGPHQAPHPFYYYFPSPLYFDQASGAASGPPNHLYHPSTFHPQFFAVPGPAYLPNAHGFNQHQPQPHTASQSDATMLNQPPPQPQQQSQQAPAPQQQQSHQPTQQSPQQQQQQQTKDR